MKTLVIKTKNNKIYESNQAMHFQVAEENSIDLNNIINKGYRTRNNKIKWDK